jgi:tetratricopeptide (TPR) repeat protein
LLRGHRAALGQEAALNEITLFKVNDAIRKKNYDGAIKLARQVFPETSKNFSDHLMLGRVFMTAGKTDEAGKEFYRAVELGPGVPDPWLTYVQFLVQTKQPDKARAAALAARQALPADRAAFTLAQCFTLVGEAEQAEKLMDKALLDGSTAANAAALRTAVMLYLSQKRLEKVEACLDKLNHLPTATLGDKAWSNRIRVVVLLSSGRPTDSKRSLRLIDENLSADRDNIEDQKLKATILSSIPGRRGDAVPILEKLAAADHLDANARFQLAQLYLIEHADQKYQEQMQKLLNQKTRDPKHLAHFIDFLIGRNELEQAERWLAELKKTEPRGVVALDREARLLDARKQKSELRAFLEARGRDVPDQIGAVADLFSRHGFAKEAEAAYKEFVAQDPRKPERALALAQFLARQDRVTEAMAILKKAWSTCPPEQVATAASLVFDAPSAGEAERRQVEAWLTAALEKRPDQLGLKTRLATVWLMQGRLDESAKCYRGILAKAPDNADALNNLAWLLALRDQGKPQEALELINRAIDVTGPVSSLFDTRAVVLIRAGQLDRAIIDLDRARTGDPRNPNVAVHLAWAYQADGKTDLARKAFQQAKDLGWKVAKSDPLERSFMEKLRSELGQ